MHLAPVHQHRTLFFLGSNLLYEATEMIDGILLQTVEGLGDAPPDPTGYEIWESLHSEKQEIILSIQSEGSLCQTGVISSHEVELSEESGWAIEWRHRGQLEARLREISEAQDRLFEGAYGRCTDCGGQIDSRRLEADPAVSLCITCRKSVETKVMSFTL
jgi:RNA polymerase-binding transcription factor DksA